MAGFNGCSVKEIKKPNTPFCIANGDGTVSCTKDDKSYIDGSMNYICTTPDGYEREQDFWTDIETRLLKACASNRKARRYCEGLDMVKE